ncbi:MAG: DNA polymerase Y family protein [Sandaracinaceae bacterium]|nr:DNA polymerase Y family protein [Sandaracinaceae bacterium]
MRARVACVDIPALPLQLLARAHPSWRDAPFAVVEADEPQAKIEWVDPRAAALRIRVGMRYASALSISRDLRAAPVSVADIAALRAQILESLQARTPRVEPDAERPGVFWLDPSGLGPLFGSLEKWSAHVHGALTTLELRGAVVVGFARLPAWAVARGRDDALVLRSAAEEAELAGRARLVHLDLPPELRSALAALDVHHLSGFLALPRGEVGLRFGPEASRLHALFDDALRPPMQPAGFEEPIAIEAELDPPDDDANRLLFCVKGALHALMAELGARSLALRALTLRFELERHPDHVEHLEPARATRDAGSVIELVRLRIADVRLGARVERVVLVAEPARLDGRQLELFRGRRRDPDAAARSIARLRAAFGDPSVTRAVVRDAWLPEHRFAYEPTTSVDAPDPSPGDGGALVRRVLPRPEAVPHGRDGRPRTQPPLVELTGPYRVQGGWWMQETLRDYWFGERADGALLWLYQDGSTGGWFLHGHVD